MIILLDQLPAQNYDGGWNVATSFADRAFYNSANVPALAPDPKQDDMLALRLARAV